jgi:hypothetical protein
LAQFSEELKKFFAARLLLDAAPVASAGGLERDQQAEQTRSHPENRMTPSKK